MKTILIKKNSFSLKGSFISSFDYIFLINNCVIEIYVPHKKEYSYYPLYGDISNRLMEIDNYFSNYRDKRKIIIAGEPIIFYRENLDSDSHPSLYENSESKRYFPILVKNYKLYHKSYKYFKKSFFLKYYRNTFFVDFNDFLSFGLSDNSYILGNTSEDGVFKLFNSKSFSKLSYKELSQLIDSGLELFSYDNFQYLTERNIVKIRSGFKLSQYDNRYLNALINNEYFETTLLGMYRNKHINIRNPILFAQFRKMCLYLFVVLIIAFIGYFFFLGVSISFFKS